ncbi:hypothetical protein DIPPA_07189 [Diplonema papillatum]|nr:hypothetical protein DIPPA_07189 [Diplonema papillatum]
MQRAGKLARLAVAQPRCRLRFCSSPASKVDLFKEELVSDIRRSPCPTTLPQFLYASFAVVGFVGSWKIIFEAVYDAYSDPYYGEEDEEEDED